MHNLNDDVVSRILERTMPSFQLTSARESNLGLGYIYYGLARSMRPKKTVVIGSKAGFAPLCFARAIADNDGSRISHIDCEDVLTSDATGTLDFVDPSFSKDAGDVNHSHGIGFWDSTNAAASLWDEFGVSHVATHFKQTSAAYLESHGNGLQIDLLYIDGDHSYAGILHDFTAFLPFLGRESLVLAHDVDPRCHSARGYEVLSDMAPGTYEVSRLPLYPGLAFMLPVCEDVGARGFAPLATIGGGH
jgi:predicted O-methyltransferase YrrM